MVPEAVCLVAVAAPALHQLREHRLQTAAAFPDQGRGVGNDLVGLPVAVELHAVELGGAYGENVRVA